MLLETLRLAIEAIWRNALRSILTLLGITIGVAAVISMITLGQGATAQVSNSFSSLGSNMVMLVPGRLRQGGFGTQNFKAADLQAVERQIQGLDAVSAASETAMTAIAGSNSRAVQVDGVDLNFFRIFSWGVEYGRSFREGEVAAGELVCIIGATVADNLFGVADPIGQKVRLRRLNCTVIGVMQKRGALFGQSRDDVVLMPLTTFQRRIAGNTDVMAIYVAAASVDDVPRIETDLTTLMRDRRHLAAKEDNDFSVTDMQQISSTLGSVMGVLTGLLAAIAGISLVVGGIGIMNIMLVSVSERTREIGIRLAIGARESQVLAQFLAEAIALSALGGLTGILLGLGLSVFATNLLGVPFVFDWSAVLFAFVFSATIGVAFGYFPARHAAHLDPIEALRHE